MDRINMNNDAALADGPSDEASSVNDAPPSKPKAKRGFGAMSPERQKEIASKGGKAAFASGRGHIFTSEAAKIAGRKGGKTTAARRGVTHMASIGKKGGDAVWAAKEGATAGDQAAALPIADGE
jgi:hypothetical protein